jgi:hypothetical protein
MSLLYLHFATNERAARAQKLGRSGAHVVVSEPRWPGFFELAKKEKPYAIAIDFSHAPSHALETADYLAKAKETREAALYLLRVPADRVDIVAKRLPNAPIVTELELSEKLLQIEKEAQERAREKKEAAAQARKSARARASAAGKPSVAAARAKAPPRPAKPVKPEAKKKKKPAVSPRKTVASRKKIGGKKSRGPSRKR